MIRVIDFDKIHINWQDFNNYCIFVQSAEMDQQLHFSYQSSNNNDEESHKIQITHSKPQMNHLAHNQQKFLATFDWLIKNAEQKINSENPANALIYLQQSERIVEYVASCGKNIDKNIILCVLHNLACCYQQLWQLQKCSNYLQALIFNIQSYLQKQTPTPIQQVEDLLDRKTIDNFGISMKGKPINTRIELCEYYLQFCAINSQNGKHDIASAAAKTVISIMVEVFHEMAEQRQNKSINIKNAQHKQNIMKIAGGISRTFQEYKVFDITKTKDYSRTMKYCLSEWNYRQQLEANDELNKLLNKLSIGHIMKIKPYKEQLQKKSGFYSFFQDFTDQQSIQNIKSKNVGLIQLTHQIILLVIALFTLSTQTRLIVLEKKQNYKASKEYQQSEMYNLIALIILFIYVPYDMLLVKHILTGYLTNFGGKVNQDDEYANVMIQFFDYYRYSSFKKSEKSLDLTKKCLKNTNEQKVPNISDEMKTVNFLQKKNAESIDLDNKIFKHKLKNGKITNNKKPRTFSLNLKRRERNRSSTNLPRNSSKVHIQAKAQSVQKKLKDKESKKRERRSLSEKNNLKSLKSFDYKKQKQIKNISKQFCSPKEEYFGNKLQKVKHQKATTPTLKQISKFKKSLGSLTSSAKKMKSSRQTLEKKEKTTKNCKKKSQKFIQYYS